MAVQPSLKVPFKFKDMFIQKQALEGHTKCKRGFSRVKLVAGISQEVAHAEGLQLALLEHSKQESKMRLEVEATAKQLAEKYEARARAHTEEADARRRAEVAEVEDRGNAHVQVSC